MTFLFDNDVVIDRKLKLQITQIKKNNIRQQTSTTKE